MAKTPTELYHEVTRALATLTERVDNLRRDVDGLRKDSDDARAFREKSLEGASKLSSDIDLARQRLDDHLKRVETWEGRRWGLIVGFGTLFVGAILSLASGLIVTLVKK